MKSARNKTIDFSAEIGEQYLKKCVRAEDYDGETDVTILGDFFIALQGVKDSSVDLLIVDPPYNLFKDFGGKKFKKLENKEYADYTEKWIKAILPKLKPAV